LIFVGKMDYRPNIDAVLWFADKVLPRISVVLPQVCFQIVGMNPHSRLDRLRTQPNIEIIGAVEDVRPYIYAAGVYVIPLRIGGGTRFKALEAMACAKPVVSTSMGVEGLGVQHGEHFILADQPAEFAQAVLALLRNPNSEATGAMCQRACRFVETHYGWERIVPKFDTMYALQDIPGMY
jgi:glycosyltransferase involved in cell wall biosynthesis